MKEEKRHLYRLDPAKIQQKIYESYPSNSVTHKKIIEEAKQQELETIQNTLQSFPVKLSFTLLEQDISEIKKYSLKFLVWFLGFSAVLYGSTQFLTTMFEVVLVILISGWCLGHSLINFSKLVRQVLAVRELSTAINKLTNKVEKMKKRVLK